MKHCFRQYIYILFIILSSISCRGEKKLVLNNSVLQEIKTKNFDYAFHFSDTDNSVQIENLQSKQLYTVSNIETTGFHNDLDYAILLENTNTDGKIILVLNNVTKEFDWCDFYPKTSYFFTDQLVCFSVKPYTPPSSAYVYHRYHYQRFCS